MNLTNFCLLSNQGLATKIETAEGVFDLHNSGDFSSFTYDVEKQNLELCWIADLPRQAASEPRTWCQLSMIFENTDRFEVTARDPEMPNNEDMVLDIISSISCDDDIREYLDGVVQIFSSMTGFVDSPDNHILFKFRGGQMIRVHSETATVTVTPLH